MKNLKFAKLEDPYLLFWWILLVGLSVVIIIQITFTFIIPQTKIQTMDCGCPSQFESII